MAYADLHIHSKYSDGSLSPAEIVRIARAANVSLLSVCDHNLVQGTLEARPLALATGMDYLTGVEIDAMFEGLDIHILCYGADLGDDKLLGRIRHARERLDEMSAELLRRMQADFPQLDMDEYNAMQHDTSRGGWKMLQYLNKKGVTPNLKAGYALYERYGVGYDTAGFDSIEAVVQAIHAAGGKAVLAHPGVSFSTESLNAVEAQVERAMQAGLDGVECYYVRHSAGVTRRLIGICERHGAMITAGSDCHGAFSHNEIGQTRTPIDRLNLGWDLC